MGEQVTVIALRDTAITKPEPIRLHKGELYQLPKEWAKHFAELGDVRLYAPAVENKMVLPIAANKNATALAEKLGIDLSLIEGTGRGGRIVKKDVQKYAEALDL
jgi:pyruvate/2-oxoglutarate dehydrogenase complex dihydrolipoamide acyltransferase (E2) component